MRGLKQFLRSTQRGRLTGGGRGRCFRRIEEGSGPRARLGAPLSGLTKLIEQKLFSAGQLPYSATHGYDPGRWVGTSGRARGSAVDAQLTRVVNRGAPASSATFKLSQYVLAFLRQQKMAPVLCQRVVLNARLRVATAIDMLCYEAATGSLWVVELKSGFAGDRNAPAVGPRGACMLRGPLSRVSDCLHTRHALQAVLSRQLLVEEPELMDRLSTRFSITPEDVKVGVLYVNGHSVDLVEPDKWWLRAANKSLTSLRGI